LPSTHFEFRTKNSQLAPTYGYELAACIPHVPCLVSGRCGKNLKNVTRAKSKFQVEKSFSKFDRLYRSLGKAAADFQRCVYWCWKTKLMTVVLACASYSTIFDEPPKTFNNETRIGVENEFPIELPPRDRLKSLPDEPIKFAHVTSALRLSLYPGPQRI
jgi:hypothetical protein